MKKVLQVINPFFLAELGDKFEYNAESNTYKLTKSEEFYKIADDTDSEIKSSYNATFDISEEYAHDLIDEGYLKEEDVAEPKKSFVNVFDEVDRLINMYNTELSNVDNDMKDAPQCLKVEKTTVLNNIIKVLGHLKNLKK